jgi:hypothetical protein
MQKVGRESMGRKTGEQEKVGSTVKKLGRGSMGR